MIFLIDIIDIGEIGFVIVMLAITWFNRMFNGSTSGKWTTLFLLVVALTPPVLRIDDFIAWIMDKDSGFIPLDEFSYTMFGIFWASIIYPVHCILSEKFPLCYNKSSCDFYSAFNYTRRWKKNTLSITSTKLEHKEQ